MDVIGEGEAPPELPNGSVVTLGCFDGVHLGHQRVIAEARRLARDRQCPAVAFVLDRVSERGAPGLLTALPHRLELLGECGVDVASPRSVASGATAASQIAQLREVVLRRWRTQVVVEGESARPEQRGHSEKDGPEVEWVPTVREGGTGDVVSSALVREVLTEGDVRRAARLAGRPHEIRGEVELGDRRGRTIGFPTANLVVSDDIHLPADGVYSGWYERPGGEIHVAAISIGRRPTFYAEAGVLLVEAYLLDFDGDLYGEDAKVRLDDRIRGQERFGSVDELRSQLARDVSATRRLVGRRRG